MGLEYRKKNRTKESEREAIWRENNREKYNSAKRDYWNNNKEMLNDRKRQLISENPRYLLGKKIRDWRQKQKALTLCKLEFLEKETCTSKIYFRVPTLVHCHLLFE